MTPPNPPEGQVATSHNLTRALSLDRMLQQQGFGTRKLCRALVLAGKVSVEGRPCDDPDLSIVWHSQAFTVRGEAWTYQAACYLMMHKPMHLECSHKPQHHPSIYSLLPRPLVERGVQCIGRLDEDTTGLILLSDDGQFIHQSSSPKHKVGKVYEVTCKHPLPADALQLLTQGVMLVDEPLPIAALRAVALSNHVIHLTLAEGKYHQVKRMVAAVGNRVVGLKRVKVGLLELPVDLHPGQWRWMTAEEATQSIQTGATPSAKL